MPPPPSPPDRLLARIPPGDLVGRGDELRAIAALAASPAREQGLLLLAAPGAGATELLRQAYDRLFGQRGGAPPVYFAWSRRDQTTVGAARRFLHAFLSQLVAHRRGDAAYVGAPPPLSDLIELADAADYEWIGRLVGAFERARAAEDEHALVRLCLSAPQLAAAHGVRSLVMLDDVHAVARLRGGVHLGAEIARAAAHAQTPFVVAGLRRALFDVLNGESPHRFGGFGTLHLGNLDDGNARTLVERLASAHGLGLNEEARDLAARQFAGSPYFISAFMQAAGRAGRPLTSFLACQQLYVDELLGGRAGRRFDSLLEQIAPRIATRRALVRVLHEAALAAGGKVPAEALRRRLELEPEDLYPVMSALHVYELAGFNATFLQLGADALWRDYLRASYRLQVAAEPRALVVADTLVEALKRAPRTMERHYRRAAALNLKSTLARFDAQRVPASLLHYDRYSRLYRGRAADEITSGLNVEADLVRLPQIVHAASCASFHPPLAAVCDEERCAVAHGFDALPYADANEVVWLAAEVEGKAEAGRALTEVWCDRLAQVAGACGFARTRLWLVASEGFSAEACELLNERGALSSSRQMLELLLARLGVEAEPARPAGEGVAAPDEFEMVIPMGNDTELIAASTAEQIARRLDFQPEEISQIKTAVVEACINAAEHSLSPDRKIYQRFRLESDKLTVIISSRGVTLPASAVGAVEGDAHVEENNGRRGWGLRLIRALMDEVEFERVDDGTRLRMTKYLRR